MDHPRVRHGLDNTQVTETQPRPPEVYRSAGVSAHPSSMSKDLGVIGGIPWL